MKDMNDLLRAAQEAAQTIQAQMSDAQGALDKIEVEGAAGGGLVRIRATAKGRIIGVQIDDSLLAPSEKPMLEDLVAAAINDVPFLILDAPALFDRDGGLYGDAAGRDWHDNWRRFAALSRAAADVAGGIIGGRAYDVLHAHDWQAAMAPAYLRYDPAPGRSVRTVVTIHNIAFQGRFDAGIFPDLGLPAAAWGIDGVEFHGGVGFLKAAAIGYRASSTASIRRSGIPTPTPISSRAIRGTSSTAGWPTKRPSRSRSGWIAMMVPCSS